jgi:hypothetical protein
MTTDDEFTEALRDVVAEVSARYFRVRLPDQDTDPKTRILAALVAGLLDGWPDEVSAELLRQLGEAAVRDGG